MWHSSTHYWTYLLLWTSRLSVCFLVWSCEWLPAHSWSWGLWSKAHLHVSYPIWPTWQHKSKWSKLYMSELFALRKWWLSARFSDVILLLISLRDSTCKFWFAGGAEVSQWSRETPSSGDQNIWFFSHKILHWIWKFWGRSNLTPTAIWKSNTESKPLLIISW